MSVPICPTCGYRTISGTTPDGEGTLSFCLVCDTDVAEPAYQVDLYDQLLIEGALD